MRAIADWRLRIADWTHALRIRNPKSAIRNWLLFALAACGRSDGPRATVTIPAGASLDAAIDSLAASRVLAHPGSFRLYAKLRGLGKLCGLADAFLDEGTEVAKLGRTTGLTRRSSRAIKVLSTMVSDTQADVKSSERTTTSWNSGSTRMAWKFCRPTHSPECAMSSRSP